MAPIKVTDIRTVAGLNLWEWFESDALPLGEFGFKTGYEAILAIESEVLAKASYLPLDEIERLRRVERLARAAADADEDYMRRINDPEGYLSVSTTPGWQAHEASSRRAQSTMSLLAAALRAKS